MTPRRSLIITATVACVVLAFCNRASAQSMSASVYSDFGPASWGGDLWMDSWATSESNSGECEHLSFQTTATVISPTGRSYSQTMYQFYSGASLDFQQEEGNWEITSLLEFNCSCDGNVGVSFGTVSPAFYHQTYYTDPTRYTSPQTACAYFETACTSGTVVCGMPPYFDLDPPPVCSPFVQVTWMRMWLPGGYRCAGMAFGRNEGGACF